MDETAAWSRVRCDGETLTGISSRRGAFRIPLREILAVGQHVRYPDETDPIAPNEHSWIGFLTADEYGLVLTNEAEYAELVECIALALDDERLLSLLWSWSGWNQDRGADARFVYPPWVFGLAVYEWPVERQSPLRSLLTRLTDLYCFPSSQGILSAPARRLAAPRTVGDSDRWEAFLVAPPRPKTLGTKRFAVHWHVPFAIWWLPYVVLFIGALGGAAFHEELLASPGGWSVLAGLALLLSTCWFPQIVAGTALFDHGLVVHTWWLRRERAFYDDIIGVQESGGRLHVRLRKGKVLRLGRFVGRSRLDDMCRLSLTIRYAEASGFPCRLPYTGG